MRYPEFLPNNGRIGFIAPSFGAAGDWYGTKFKAALENFERMGYSTVVGPNCYEVKGIGKSNTPQKCGAEINDFFLNDKSDVIISVGGGETMCEDLDFVDFEAIAKADPKWFMGYSDNTFLTFTLPTLCDTAAIYGQCATSFGQSVWHDSLYDSMSILSGRCDEKRAFSFQNYSSWEGAKTVGGIESAYAAPFVELNPLEPWKLTEPSCVTSYASGNIVPTEKRIQFSGRLLGGCIDCLQVLCGTKYDRVNEFAEKYKEDGIIWFLEACDLNPMGIRRALWQFKEAGWFKNAKGFIIGRPLHFHEEMLGMNRTNAVIDCLSELEVPILMDTDLGHLPPVIPYISGAFAFVKAGAGHMVVSQSLR